ncbi:hypothetical protein GIB67_041069 [Kingdonia uniflora]|uniref:DNA 3'-5' helicase n=1 Tax=Kingdonia uniflora TaxID=39325 RepID=A0A7J7LK09_9MAGN|nr:hypothetical protein GIB67_041069 [Kingdonia uniflora]
MRQFSSVTTDDSKKKKTKIFKSLQEAGIKAGIYHGQMTGKDREESHRSFVRDELHVMVATIAFGMGVDKPNIRHVIHYGCPKSLESYYQGSGRCGRDGLASNCWLYYTRSDFVKADFYCGEVDTEIQRTTIMESFISAQKYCSLTTCRRKFLLEYFGEKFTPSNCGNCDNCTNTKMERDMTSEAFLLLSSIDSCSDSCSGRWGLGMPVDVLRGSRSKRILQCQFDKLPLHGFGKHYSSKWWRALAEQLISHGIVSPKGEQFLNTANSDNQPGLVLTVTGEMEDEEERGSTTGKAKRNFQKLTTTKSEELSVAEEKLYHMLLDTRGKLAKSIGVAPYCICGDQTIKTIAMIRPSTEARLSNIDGVNQHLVSVFGDQILRDVHSLSLGLDLSLDPRESKIPTSQRKLYPEKLEVWKMWQGDGLTFQEIANRPGRPAPVTEQVVYENVFEAAKEGFNIDWTRFCDEIGMTRLVRLKIHGAISKIGSRERLKPIKDELPEYVSYAHIKAFLTMQDVGLSTEDIIELPCKQDNGSHRVAYELF